MTFVPFEMKLAFKLSSRRFVCLVLLNSLLNHAMKICC